MLEDPFSYQVTKAGQVLVSRGGRQVAVVAGAKAIRLIALLSSADADEIQLALAKATGNYKRGNERR